FLGERRDQGRLDHDGQRGPRPAPPERRLLRDRELPDAVVHLDRVPRRLGEQLRARWRPDGQGRDQPGHAQGGVPRLGPRHAGRDARLVLRVDDDRSRGLRPHLERRGRDRRMARRQEGRHRDRRRPRARGLTETDPRRRGGAPSAHRPFGTLGPVRAAICQLNAGADDVAANVANAERLVGEAADGGAELVVLPELFAYYGSQRRMREMAEPLGGPITSRLAGLARDRSIWVLGGSVCEAAEGRVYNTSFLFDRDGEAVARYRKIHLYDAELPGQRPIRESA